MVVIKLLLVGGLIAFSIYEIVQVVKMIKDNKKARLEREQQKGKISEKE